MDYTIFSYNVIQAFTQLVDGSKVLSNLSWVITEPIFVLKDKHYICMIIHKTTGYTTACVFPYECNSLEAIDLTKIIFSSIQKLLNAISLKNIEPIPVKISTLRLKAQGKVTQFKEVYKNKIVIMGWVKESV